MDKVKPNLEKPFSIEAYEAGAEFCDVQGEKYRIIATDRKGDYPVVALLMDGESELVRVFNTNGRCKSIQLFEILTEPTHREDGTPLDISPLPEVEGWRFEYRGKGWDNDGGKCHYITFIDIDVWDRNPSDAGYAPRGEESIHYAEAFPIAKPTTIEDLFADGPVCYLHSKNGGFHQVLGVSDDRFAIRHKSKWSLLKDVASWDYYRYSNSPLTKWEDAKPFVGKEGE